MIGLAIEGHPEAPTTSWWIGPASEFYQRARDELGRMQRSRFGWQVTGAGNVRPAEKQRAISRPSATDADAMDA